MIKCKCSTDGEFVRRFAADKLKQPRAIVLDINGDVIITDEGSHSVQMFKHDGTLLRAWGKKGSGKGEFNNPRQVVLAVDGKAVVVVVADTDNHRIQIFKRDGTFIRAFGKYGGSGGDFNQVYGVAVTANAEIIASDYGNCCIQVL